MQKGTPSRNYIIVEEQANEGADQKGSLNLQIKKSTEKSKRSHDSKMKKVSLLKKKQPDRRNNQLDHLKQLNEKRDEKVKQNLDLAIFNSDLGKQNQEGEQEEEK